MGKIYSGGIQFNHMQEKNFNLKKKKKKKPEREGTSNP